MRHAHWVEAQTSSITTSQIGELTRKFVVDIVVIGEDNGLDVSCDQLLADVDEAGRFAHTWESSNH